MAAMAVRRQGLQIREREAAAEAQVRLVQMHLIPHQHQGMAATV